MRPCAEAPRVTRFTNDAVYALVESRSMSSIVALTDELSREEVARARALSPEEKLLEGPRLFERACRVMADGIRHQHPDLDEEGVRTLVMVRLARVQALESR
jgi:hypothetical protein